MGGAVLFGIKKRDGTVFYQERWTNQMPLILSNPAFMRGEPSAIAELEEDAHPDHKWPWPVALKKYKRSEYGGILVDFKLNIMFSRQGYTAPGGLIFSPHSGDYGELGSRLVELHKEKRITEIQNWNPAPVKVPEKEATSFLELLEGLLDTESNGREQREDAFMDHPLGKNMLDIRFSSAPLIVDHKGRSLKDPWKDLRKFRIEHDWP